MRPKTLKTLSLFVPRTCGTITGQLSPNEDPNIFFKMCETTAKKGLKILKTLDLFVPLMSGTLPGRLFRLQVPKLREYKA